MVTSTYRSSDARSGRSQTLRKPAEAAGRRFVGYQWLDDPIRTDLLSLEELKYHAKKLAERQRTIAGSRRDRLLGRLDESAGVLQEANRFLTVAAAEGAKIPESGIWLLDNYYLIREEIRAARRDLSHKFCRSLPRLVDGSCAEMPRVYELALDLITQLDGHLDQDNLSEYVSAYQSVSLLTLAELRAVPTMLRLAGIENLRRVSLRIARGLQVPAEESANEAEGNEAADEVAMRNCVKSLAGVGALDWNEFVDEESAVEQTLRKDPADVYGKMDFASRDRYRVVVERLAEQSSRSEPEVALRVLELARQADVRLRAPDCSPTRREAVVGRHVGYFLVDEGKAILEKSIGCRHSLGERAARAASAAPLGAYLGAMSVVWLLTIGTAWGLEIAAAGSVATCTLLFILFAGAASQFAVSIVNWACSLLVTPRPILRLDFSRGIPRDSRTLVAVPVMLTTEREIRDLAGQLELRYLANQDANLFFALVTDFPDAARERLPSDRHLLAVARAEIERLNRKYRDCGRAPFYLMHRPRKWNPQEGAWMGEERKRGKLGALNQLLLHGSRAAFSDIVGNLEELEAVRYVITLDADTRLGPATGRELAGCMAHPLNWPEVDPATKTVVRGHALLQPRVSVTIPQANRSIFSRLLAGDAGIDPYTRQTSDVYQDLFGRGSFIGKGIYDVEAFEATLGRRFPTNRILSHDLLEGCYAGSGLVSDVELFEGVPSGFLAEMKRRHRWIRGDWQIAAWLSSSVPSEQGSEANSLDSLSRWKVFDNLRRSLAPVFLLGFLAAGWILAPALADRWLLLAAAIVFGPMIVGRVPSLLRKPKEKPWGLHLADQGRSARAALCAEAFSLCVLPYIVHANLDAILRTFWRLAVSQKKLLEWTTSSDSERLAPHGLRNYCTVMSICAAVGFGLTCLLAIGTQSLGLWAAVLGSWMAAPLVAWSISRPLKNRQGQLSEAQSRQFRRWSRQTWHYFEVAIGRHDHGLPPDNVQEFPRRIVAHRTSPTNIGMGLLSDLAAHDLGYLSASGLLRRSGLTLRTLSRLERHRGHFFNWYDTRTLQPLGGRYVSSVDSGNLWGALTVLEVGLEQLRTEPIVHERLLHGLQDTLEVIAALRTRSDASPPQGRFSFFFAQLQAQTAAPFRGGAGRALRLLRRIRKAAVNLADVAGAESAEVQQWAAALVRQCSSMRRDLARLAFWTRFQHSAGESQRQAVSQMFPWLARLDDHCTLEQLAFAAERVADRIDERLGSGREAVADESKPVLASLRQAALRAADAAREQLRQITRGTQLCRRFGKMDYRFLYHRKRKLLAIGYDVDRQRRDDSYYGLVASEAHLASFLAVSHGQLPLKHWFSLGRPIALPEGQPVLLSWSGTMFEYLMPMLLMPSAPGSVIDISCRRAVERQIRFARQAGTPWGISESCFADVDENDAYQYRAFGVRGLGLKRGTGNRLVIAPYASAMASMIVPDEACRNLERLEQAGCLGPCGFYDALDYSPERDGSSAEPTLCRTVMAHHSGMALLAFTNVLLGGPMPRRFFKMGPHAAYDLLLQERMPQVYQPVDPPE